MVFPPESGGALLVGDALLLQCRDRGIVGVADHDGQVLGGRRGQAAGGEQRRRAKSAPDEIPERLPLHVFLQCSTDPSTTLTMTPRDAATPSAGADAVPRSFRRESRLFLWIALLLILFVNFVTLLFFRNAVAWGSS